MFELFNRLPIELRLKIWEAALPGPRVVNIREKRLKKTRRGRDMVALTSDTKAPSVLFACRESYSVASKFYMPSFAFADSIPETYFDHQRDILYLRFDTFALLPYDDLVSCTIDELEYLYDSANLRVQNLAVLLDPDPDQITNMARHDTLANILFLFGNVKNLTLVLGHFDQEGDDQGDILLMEPIDVTKTCHNYETMFLEPSQRQDVLDVPLNTHFVSPDELEGCLENWRRLQEEDSGEGEDLVSLPMPQIEYKSAVTGRLKRNLDCLKNRG
ncbi:hypothetical protein IFR04_011917 [Cadophora malorum]|uniref:2EXR domain-containing protein n=1 Tax=Cadophora malorum TaxID=108018 RepID=A0A8H7W2P6_9HELO|nr:hypothetical protein IFR04_011917 [Cadophora malorum]